MPQWPDVKFQIVSTWSEGTTRKGEIWICQLSSSSRSFPSDVVLARFLWSCADSTRVMSTITRAAKTTVKSKPTFEMKQKFQWKKLKIMTSSSCLLLKHLLDFYLTAFFVFFSQPSIAVSKVCLIDTILLWLLCSLVSPYKVALSGVYLNRPAADRAQWWACRVQLGSDKIRVKVRKSARWEVFFFFLFPWLDGRFGTHRLLPPPRQLLSSFVCVLLWLWHQWCISGYMWEWGVVLVQQFLCPRSCESTIWWIWVLWIHHV